jgi:carbonic anhydrase
VADQRDDLPGLGGDGQPQRVYDIREWTPRPALRRVGAPRALWARGQAPQQPVPPPITPVRPVPVRAKASEAAVAATPMLLIGCAESAALDRLASGLGASTVFRNMGGVAPRSPQGRGDATSLEAALEAAVRHGGPLHVACVGHRGCHALSTSTRYASTAHEGLAPERAVRAVEHHVFMQIHRVRTYLRRRGRHPEVHVSGLWVDEATGHVHVFDPGRRAFAPLVAFDLRPYAAPVPARRD